MRFILWGTIIIAWMFLRVFRAMGGEFDLNFYGRLVGLIFFLSLPVGVIFEIVRWIRKRKK